MSDLDFGRGEGIGGSVVGGDDVAEALADLRRGGETGAGEGLTTEDGEPDLDLSSGTNEQMS